MRCLYFCLCFCLSVCLSVCQSVSLSPLPLLCLSVSVPPFPPPPPPVSLPLSLSLPPSKMLMLTIYYFFCDGLYFSLALIEVCVVDWTQSTKKRTHYVSNTIWQVYLDTEFVANCSMTELVMMMMMMMIFNTNSFPFIFSCPAFLHLHHHLWQDIAVTLPSASDPLSLQSPRTGSPTVVSRAFSVFGLFTWNDLPLPLQQKPSLDSFKSGLKKFLFFSETIQLPCFPFRVACCLLPPQVPVCCLSNWV